MEVKENLYDIGGRLNLFILVDTLMRIWKGMPYSLFIYVYCLFYLSSSARCGGKGIKYVITNKYVNQTLKWVSRDPYLSIHPAHFKSFQHLSNPYPFHLRP